jgi:hypothetical protein
MKEIFNPTKVDPVPPVQRVEPTPGIAPSWALVVAALKSVGLPDAKTRATLDKLGEKFTAELSKMRGYSHDDARREFKRLVHAALDSNTVPENLPASDELIRRNSLFRQVCRSRASAVSREGCLLAADVLEKALAQLPKFTGELLAAESALHQGITLTGSPLKKLCDELPAFFKLHIANLRGNPTPMVNPSQLLK